MSDFAYPLHEECGVFGIYDRAGTEDVAAAAYSALYALQHRGQESCGIAVNDAVPTPADSALGPPHSCFAHPNSQWGSSNTSSPTAITQHSFPCCCCAYFPL